MLVDVVSEEIQFSDAEEALVGVDNDAMCGETVENSSQVPEVLLGSGTGNEDIINVCVGEGDTSEDVVHKSLKRLCCVSQAEGHAHKLEQAEWCCDGRLGNVDRVYRDLIVCTYKVQFRKDGGTL